MRQVTFKPLYKTGQNGTDFNFTATATTSYQRLTTTLRSVVPFSREKSELSGLPDTQYADPHCEADEGNTTPEPRSVGRFSAGVLLAGLGDPREQGGAREALRPISHAELNRCTTCHLPSENKNPESLEEFPHNPFGDRLRALGEELAKAGKRRTSRRGSQRVAAEDSDGDGVDNEMEMLARPKSGRRAGQARCERTRSVDADERAEFAEVSGIVSLAAVRPCSGRPSPRVKNADWVRNPIEPSSPRSTKRADSSRGRRRKGGPAAPGLSRSDRPVADARGATRFLRTTSPRRLREGRRSAARRSALRRAMGPALDGHLALQRLGRLDGRQADARQPAAHLALARLDRRVAQRRQGLRPHGRGDARRR